MPATAAAEPKLVCPECTYENVVQRIYCHECGARLDRTRVAKLKENTEEDPKQTYRRLKDMFDPARGRMRQRLFVVGKIILGACVAAAIVQMLRSPDLPPRANRAQLELPPQITFDLERVTETNGAQPLRYSEEQVNAYLLSALRSKQSMLSKYLKFERANIAFDEGTARVTMERSLYGFSVFTTGIYDVKLENGKLACKSLGGQIGRLPFHPQIMKYADVVFSDLASALERERKLVVKLGAIELHPKQVAFLPK